MKKVTKRSKPVAAKKKAVNRVRTASGAKKSVARHTPLPAKKPPVGVAIFPSSLALYVYGITQIPSEPLRVTSEAIDGHGVVEPVAQGNYLCWASRVSRHEFATDLQKNMENLDWLAACSIRHQKILAEIGAVTQVLPARFGTVFLTPESLLKHLKERTPYLRKVFQRIAEADEWGVKVFGTHEAQPSAVVKASSGSDYLRQKSAALQSAPAARRDEALVKLGEELASCSIASVPGGKASTSQPGLLWSGSFLVKRAHKDRFDKVLKRYAGEWAPNRRIDVSGPWPPYSFVSESE